LERGVERIDDLEAEPQTQARLLEALGDVSWALGAYDRAEPLLERAISLRSEGPAADPLRLAFAADRLGGLYRDRAELAAAAASHRRALSALEAGGAGESA